MYIFNTQHPGSRGFSIRVQSRGVQCFMCCVLCLFVFSSFRCYPSQSIPGFSLDMATTQLFYIKIKEGEGKFSLFATKVFVTSSTWKIFPPVKNSGSTYFPFCTQGIILFSRVFFSSLFFPFVSFSLLLLNVSTLCLEVCTRVPVCISKQLTIISSLLSTEIIRIELIPPGLKARAFYPLSCLTSLRSLEGSYSLLTWCTVDDVSFYFAVFKMVSFPAVWPWYA